MNPRSRVTLDDIAAAAGVSNATVSRALNGLPNVTPSTRDRVLAAATELGYFPERHAARRRERIGVVVPILDQWFYAKISAAIEETFATHGFEAIRYTLAASPWDREQLLEDILTPDHLDGLITVSFPLREAEEERLLAWDHAVAVNTPSTRLPSVSIDDYSASRAAVQHLINLGHRRIGLITTLLDDPVGFAQTPLRTDGHRDALEGAGLSVDDALILPGNNTAQGGADAMATMMATADPPTAVFAMSDEMAIGATKTVRDLGLTVPADVSVIGFDDHDLAPFFGLTTVRQSVGELGSTAALMLERSIRAGTELGSVTLPTQLVLRETTAPPR